MKNVMSDPQIKKIKKSLITFLISLNFGLVIIF